MVIICCTLIIMKWLIHHFDQRVTADAKRYHTWLYVKCTKIYDHICTQIWRSVSVSGHGNPILKQLTWPTRVRSPLPQSLYLAFSIQFLNNGFQCAISNFKMMSAKVSEILMLRTKSLSYYDFTEKLIDFWKLETFFSFSSTVAFTEKVWTSENWLFHEFCMYQLLTFL